VTAFQDPILNAFSHLASRREMKPLIVRGDRRLAAGDLSDLARSYDRALPSRGLESGEIVGLAASHAPGFLAGLLALRRRGCAALLLDGAGPRVERDRVARQMGARGVFSCSGSWPTGRGGFQFAETDLPADQRLRVASEIATIKLTSGSTGFPQGILTPSEALLADEASLARTMGLIEGERILASIPLSHSYGLSSIAMPALARGATIVIPTEDTPVSPMLTAAAQGVTFLPSVPAFLGALVRLTAPPPLPETVRRVVSAGSPLPPSTAIRFREIYGRPIQVFYGSSECGGICYDREGTAGEDGSVGTPVDGVRVFLEPADAVLEVGRGAVCVESPAVARSYFPRLEPHLANGRFRSRDLAEWRAGRLVLLGRIDDLINVRGRNVNPREVEEILSWHEGVEEVAAFGVPSHTGDGEVVRAVVACAPGSVDAAALRAWCRRHLADYKVPRSVVLVERLPRTERAKLDRAALRALGPSIEASRD
jgi:acyl-CoA synthetase (AMP-forming)/AMP-acid ligase II